MKITYVEVSHCKEHGEYTSLWVFRGDEPSYYAGHTQHFFERACLLLNLFYAQGR